MVEQNYQTKELDNEASVVKPAQTYTKPWKLLLTLLVILQLLCVGMLYSLYGPSLMHLRELFKTDTITISLARSLQAVGNLGGSVLGGIFFTRFHNEFQFLLLSVIRCTIIVLLPWSPSVYVFMVLMTVFGLVQGYFMTGCYPYIFNLWKGSNIAKSMIQGLMFAFAIGNMISPMIAKPFLHELNWTYVNLSEVNISAIWEPGNYETVRYPYTIVGVLFIPVIICYIAFFIRYGEKHGIQKNTESSPPKGHISNAIIPAWYKWSFLALLTASTGFTAILVMVSSGFTSLFVVEGLGWSIQEGAVLTTVYWAASTLGRLPAIPMVYCIPVKILLFVSYLVTCISYTVMLFITQLPMYVMTILTAVCGLGMSSVIANLIIWGSEQPIPNNLVSAACAIGMAIGQMIGFLTIGSLFETMGPMLFVYSLLLTIALMMVLFLLMNIVTKCYKLKQPNVEEEQETIALNK